MSGRLREDAPLRRVILLRHGQTQWNAEGRWQGRIDVPLNARGLAQAELAAARLVQDASVAVMVTSPLRRAAQTAAIIQGAFDLAGRPLRRRVDERLVEIDMGEWAGLTTAEADERHPELSAAIARGDDAPRGVSGERLSEAGARARAAFDDAVVEVQPGESVLLVMHGAVLRGLVGAVCGIPGDAMRRTFVGVENCHWVELVEARDGAWRVRSWNVGA